MEFHNCFSLNSQKIQLLLLLIFNFNIISLNYIKYKIINISSNNSFNYCKSKGKTFYLKNEI